MSSRTYVGGFLLSQLKFLLGIFKSLGVLVQLILGSLQLLLQSYQIVLELRPVAATRESLSQVTRQEEDGDGGGGGGEEEEVEGERVRARRREGDRER